MQEQVLWRYEATCDFCDYFKYFFLLVKQSVDFMEYAKRLQELDEALRKPFQDGLVKPSWIPALFSELVFTYDAKSDGKHFSVIAYHRGEKGNVYSYCFVPLSLKPKTIGVPCDDPEKGAKIREGVEIPFMFGVYKNEHPQSMEISEIRTDLFGKLERTGSYGFYVPIVEERNWETTCDLACFASLYIQQAFFNGKTYFIYHPDLGRAHRKGLQYPPGSLFG